MEAGCLGKSVTGSSEAMLEEFKMSPEGTQ